MNGDTSVRRGQCRVGSRDAEISIRCHSPRKDLDPTSHNVCIPKRPRKDCGNGTKLRRSNLRRINYGLATQSTKKDIGDKWKVGKWAGKPHTHNCQHLPPHIKKMALGVCKQIYFCGSACVSSRVVDNGN